MPWRAGTTYSIELKRVIGVLCAPFYRVSVGVLALLLWAVAMTKWWSWEAGYDVWFWTWILSLFALWLSPRLADAAPRDVALIVLWVAVGYLRLWSLFTIPSDSGDITSSETVAPVFGVDAVFQSMQAGVHPNVFQTRWGVYLAPNYVAYTITWNYFTAFRSVAAAWDILALAGMALLARRIGAQSLAYAALILVGINWWDNANARVHPIMSAACGVAWTWWAMLRACSTRHASDAVVAGILATIALRLYEPVKVLIVIIPLWWLFHAVITPSFLRNTWRQILLAGAVTVMGLWPMFTHGGRAYFFEAQSNALLYGEHLHGEFEADPLAHTARFLHLFTGERVDALVNQYVKVPVLNVVELALVFVGLFAGVRQLRQPTATIAPLWLIACCLAVAVSSQPEAGRRLSVALPAIGILAGSGLLSIFHLHRWLGPLACIALLAVDGYLNWEAFFHWAAVANR